MAFSARVIRVFSRVYRLALSIKFVARSLFISVIRASRRGAVVESTRILVIPDATRVSASFFPTPLRSVRSVSIAIGAGFEGLGFAGGFLVFGTLVFFSSFCNRFI